MLRPAHRRRRPRRRADPEPLYLAVDDPRGAFEACRAAGGGFPQGSAPGVGPLGEVARRPWGEEPFHASDPFGNPLCFAARGSVFTGRPA